MSLQIIDGKSDRITLVFLHGYLLSSQQWTNLKLHQAPWRSVLIDLPYHGSNVHLELPNQNLESYADFIQNELREHGIEEYTLVGHSMGGYIGLILLANDANLENLILLHSNIWEDSIERKQNRTRVEQVVKKNKAIFLRESLPLLFKDSAKHHNTISNLVERAMFIRVEGIVHGALSMRDRKESHELVHENRHRCFFIQGSHDSLIPLQEAQIVWEQIAILSHFYTIPNCGHMSHFENPKKFLKIIESIIHKQKIPN